MESIQHRFLRSETDEKKYVEVIIRNGYDWTKVLIGDRGEFFSQGAYGNYNYVWRDVGGDKNVPYFQRFITFLANLGEDYAISKFSSGKIYDPDETLTNVKTIILTLRRKREIEAYEASEYWSELEDFDLLETDLNFACWLQGTDLDQYDQELYQTHSTRDPPMVKTFVQTILMERLFPYLRTLEVE